MLMSIVKVRPITEIVSIITEASLGMMKYIFAATTLIEILFHEYSKTEFVKAQH